MTGRIADDAIRQVRERANLAGSAAEVESMLIVGADPRG
jgi:hypothetical protein